MFGICKYCGREIIRLRPTARWMNNEGNITCPRKGPEDADKGHDNK